MTCARPLTVLESGDETMRYLESKAFAIICFILLAAALCARSKAAELPVSSSEGAQGYATEQLAAQAGLSAAARAPGTLEQAGGVALFEGLYYPTGPVSNGDPEHFAVRIRFAGRLVAIYHTHPAKDGAAEQFSKADREVASRLKVHSYILAVGSGGVYALIDGRTTEIGEHTLCRGMECKDYYAALRHRVAVLYGQERN
jgi:hypothetical protein